MKRWISLLMTAVLLAGFAAGALTASAAGTMTATVSAATVTVGGTVTLTVNFNGGKEGVAAIDASVEYDPKVLQYTAASGAGFTANGGAGKLILSYFASEAVAPTAASVKLTFKALAAGSGGLTVSTDGFYNDDGKSLGTPKAEPKLSVTNPTLSGNADLKSLKPSKGTLTPAFKASVTSYTITVPYSETTLNLSATAAESGAKVAVSGSSSLSVGKNTRVITVTAPNGTVKKYTVVITRSPDEQTTVSQPTTTQPTSPAVEDPLEVAVDGVTMTVVDAQPDAALPNGFVWDSATVNGVVVSAAVNERASMVLLYLRDETAKTAAFYIYDADKGSFERFRTLAVPGGSYILRDMPADVNAPAGTRPVAVTVGDITVQGFTYEDVAQKDFAVVYAVAPGGAAGLYVYDVTDGSLQRYREVIVTAAAALESPKKKQPANGFAAFVVAHRQVILLCSAAAGGLALLIGAIVLAVVLARRPGKRCKH